ncbi:MAG: hypothetical protein COT84_04420 [Chlamydiae bacterium CG10_big_fil_rev_8_21_14_0_10_35_9]|nr:MAG: hypothetical protein COT84_04420 [Chlamydiae bacterium CG10_big_fil_rev_8_21_14_0_10_35_9]
MFKYLPVLALLCAPLFASWDCPGKKEVKVYNSSIDDSDLFRKCEEIVFINAEYLLWNVRQNTLDYALYSESPARNNSDSLLASGKFQRAGFGFDSGYRFSLGYFNAPKYWELKAQYAWLYSKANDSISSSSNHFLIGTFPQLLSRSLVEATSLAQLHYHVADFLIDRVFHPNPHLKLRLYAGITGAFFNQKWKVRYLDVINNTTTTTNNWNFNGVGFRTGVSFDWFWRKDVYITGIMTFANLVGKYKNRSTSITTENLSGSDDISIPVGNTSYEDWRLSFNTQFLAGPSYQRCFQKCRFEIFAGYELNIWTNVLDVFRSTFGTASQSKQTLINSGLLGLQGLTVRVNVDF